MAGVSTKNKFNYKSIVRVLSLSQQVLPKIAVSHSRSLWHITIFALWESSNTRSPFDLILESNQNSRATSSHFQPVKIQQIFILIM